MSNGSAPPSKARDDERVVRYRLVEEASSSDRAPTKRGGAVGGHRRGPSARQRACAGDGHRPVREHVATRIVVRGRGARSALCASPAWHPRGEISSNFETGGGKSHLSSKIYHEDSLDTRGGLSVGDLRVGAGCFTDAASTDAMAPRQDPIPDSYIRRCVTKDGKTRWNVRHYDPTTRRTVTLGTFAALAEAKAAYRARESGVSAAARDAAGAAAKSAGAKSERAPKPSAAARAATAAPARAAPRAKKKGEKRKKPASASAAPPPPRRRRRRSSAETAATTAIVVASPARAAARTPRDSARMRNLADAALFAAKA